MIPECTGLYTIDHLLLDHRSVPGADRREAHRARSSASPPIHVLNLVRMVFISLVLYHKPQLFDFFHGYLWQVGFVIFMLLLVIVWMWKIVKPRASEKTR